MRSKHYGGYAYSLYCRASASVWRIFFGRRKTSKAKLKPEPRWDNSQRSEYEAQFSEAEEDRIRHFEATCRQMEIEFAKCQVSNREGEMARDTEFRSFMLELAQEFSVDLEGYRKSLLEVEERQERDYRAAEDERDRIFEESQADREKTFFRTLESMEEYAQNQARFRKQQLEENRRQRDESCAGLIKLLQRKFNTVKQSIEEEFLIAHSQREDVWRNAVRLPSMHILQCLNFEKGQVRRQQGLP